MGERGPVSDFGSHIEATQASTSHPPPFPGGPYPVCTGPDLKKKNKFRQRHNIILCDLSLASDVTNITTAFVTNITCGQTCL